MCYIQYQAIDVMAFNKEMELVEKILYNLREGNRRYEEGDNDE